MRMFMCAFALALVLVAPSSAGADDPFVGEPPVCGDPTVASLSVLDCDPVEAVPSLDASMPQTTEAVAEFTAAAGVVQQLPAYCRLPADVLFYTSTDWIRLGETMATDASPCAEYYFSIPALAADKTELRGPLQPELIRALGPRFHAMAEIHFSGWSTWVAANPARTWCAAGVEARRRMVDKNYLVELGDTWSINEFSSAVRRGDGNARQNAQNFVRCLYDGGDGSLPPSAGNVFIVGIGQGTVTTDRLQERPARMARGPPSGMRCRGRSVGGARRCTARRSSRWCPTRRGTSARARFGYLYRSQTWRRAVRRRSRPRRDYLRAAHYPLASAAWRYATGFGFTDVPVETMQQFVALQEYSIRHAGACLAVTLNDRLDYFGQTVNIAARVQSLAGADEIVVTDDVLSLPGAAELVAGLQVDRSAVELKGIAGDVAVHRVRAPVEAEA